ncbi:unnamed protein product [Miscanthus lutarioriparius]|uniref:Uncharacterized protein n=1 Tax=Miscanthus lutarioriparius TaxID=422564 RepID=A0A811NWM9_9POAL|nr:unnamed protein product [Miscanthus lutarioriparius]
MAALIPLEELMDPPVRQRYDMPEDPEVFDMLNAVARQKEAKLLEPGGAMVPERDAGENTVNTTRVSR